MTSTTADERAYEQWLKQAAFTDVTYLLTEPTDDPAENLREVD